MPPHGPAIGGGSASGLSVIRREPESFLARVPRRAVFRAAIVAALSAWAPALRADNQRLPVSLEAELLAKVLMYDRTFPLRAGQVARLLIVVKKGNADSVRAGSQMRTALRAIERVGGLPHEEIELEYAGRRRLPRSARRSGSPLPTSVRGSTRTSRRCASRSRDTRF